MTVLVGIQARMSSTRLHLQELEKRANAAGARFEWKVPAVTA